MIEPKVYICHNDEDCKEAAELSRLPISVYGKPRSHYPYFIGKYVSKSGINKIVSTGENSSFKDENWYINKIELPAIDLYEKFGMNRGE